MKVIAKKPVRYGGKDYKAGDTFEADKGHDSLLSILGLVEFAPKEKRKYRRRDMSATETQA